MADRYGTDVLANDPHSSRRVRSTERPVEIGMVVEDAESGYVGAVVRIEYGRIELETGTVVSNRCQSARDTSSTAGRSSSPPHDGRHPRPQQRRRRRARWRVPKARARVARGSRIYVEGRHDAELVEQVWGDDLRVEGVVIEHLGGGRRSRRHRRRISA